MSQEAQAFPGEPTPSERIAIATARVARRKQELDNAVAEYALACQTLAVAIERADRFHEAQTNPANEKPDDPA